MSQVRNGWWPPRETGLAVRIGEPRGCGCRSEAEAAPVHHGQVLGGTLAVVRGPLPLSV